MDTLKKKLSRAGLYNDAKDKISPWLERKASDELREEILRDSAFLANDTSLSDRVKIIMLGYTSNPTCTVCGTPLKYHRSLKDFSKTCSNAKCVDEATKAKRKQTFDEMYGGFFVEVDRKPDSNVRKRMIENNPMANDEVRKKHLDSVRKWHSENPRKFAFGEHHSQKDLTDPDLDEIYKIHIEKEVPITVLSVDMGYSPSYLHKKMSGSYDLKRFSVSVPHQKLIDMVSEEDMTINDRTQIRPREIDVYIPSKKVGFEVNGLFWHSVNHTKVDLRHYEKRKMCEERGIKLLQFTDKQIMEQSEIVQSMVNNVLGKSKRIYARNTKFVTLNPQDMKGFFEANHISGYTGTKLCFGLEHDGEVFMAALLSKARFGNEGYEVYRIATKLGYCVVGGLGKLMKNIEKHLDSKPIVTYVDGFHGNGKGFESIGFSYMGETPVGYSYYDKKSDKLYHRLRFRKSEQEKLFEGFDKKLTEKQNSINAGLRLYYSSGNKIYMKY